MRKFWGIILIVIGFLFVLAAIGRITSLISSLIGLVRVFDSNIDGYQRGKIIGRFIYWIIHFAIIYFAFKYGSKLTVKKLKEKAIKRSRIRIV